jgi:hypothetical protein
MWGSFLDSSGSVYDPPSKLCGLCQEHSASTYKESETLAL